VLWALVLLSTLLSAAIVGCGTKREPAETTEAAPPSPEELAAQREAEAQRAREEAIAREYPWHGLVRAKLLRVLREPSRDAEVIGWIRRGTKVRVKAEAAGNERCAGGFYALHPEGFACAPHDILVGEAPPRPNFRTDTPPRYDQPLPFDYFYVSRQNAPLFFREPTLEEHRAALTYIRRLQHFQEDEPRKLGPSSPAACATSPPSPRWSSTCSSGAISSPARTASTARATASSGRSRAG
jgi:hypothetical protein